ncbi:bifunctional diaminohydroxyphosphoribosylaminopyrimidine deaminase/5-amino-6-(5-phosphoribosylamino)uracil reductase RibD [Oceanobacillus sojae]|uniref:bifunctional diaminohydroxyphosphoribosylaminopyrimidine deaminase/5-amino-6-(5-phosphoribosylamino)uracil reductase RibD n=1 Tax=Oceanobacillus sojae TaxID=582851 RepID=UPI0021A8B14D|nr:bifunctional diaminohydroxyphosphoribosylaminopyrimidine deaminase/5-amino-6-(5-phosphoribosylamino)uracil reductase RibD [Oceanobacillus sojae]MCT1904627.1 bifunctional diaminohydroxyphosphoribosylaminopyrimidine deaminase/5-amino-6-(5-phosphoribosylamino)uracil reductase RibD [Oceanobacillus sojae]
MEALYMEQAIELAKLGKGNTYTNPLVGAVIVKDDTVLATGFHERYGERHAEKMAVDQCEAPEDLIGATMYVTLEPCNHTGKQPPCTQMIIKNGISKVVIAQLDPNPVVAGKGKAYLESQGVQVISGVLQEKAEALNKHYNYFHRRQQPYIALKQAVSLDGKISAHPKQRTYLTGEETYKTVHEERQYFQAIMAGSGTILADNPKLLPNVITDFPPIRIILDRRGKTLDFEKYQIYRETVPVWVFTTSSAIDDVPEHVRLLPDKHWTISKVIEYLQNEGVQSVYVEGGSRIHDAFLAENLFEEVITYISPKLIGGNGVPAFSSDRNVLSAVPLTLQSVEAVGEDIRIVSRKGKKDVYRIDSGNRNNQTNQKSEPAY